MIVIAASDIQPMTGTAPERMAAVVGKVHLQSKKYPVTGVVTG